MRFEIVRTSNVFGNAKPCREAVAGELTRVDRRTYKTPEEHDKHHPQRPWLSLGTNHRKDGGGIARDMEAERAWFIEIDTLADLVALNKKYGDLVIRTSWKDDITRCIEIYDDYRE